MVCEQYFSKAVLGKHRKGNFSCYTVKWKSHDIYYSWGYYEYILENV